MNIMPVSTRLATRLPRAMSLVKTEPPRPKSESLASAIAASSSLTRKNSATGPKNSSRKAGLSGLMSVRMVGSMKEPGRSMRLPPMSTFAPCGDRTIDLLQKVNQRRFRGQADPASSSRPSDPRLSEPASAALKLLQEFVGELLDDDESLRGAAGLAGVVHPAPDRPFDGVFEIGVFENDERVAAAELHRRRLEVLSGPCRDAPAGRDAAGQRHALDARIIDDGVGLIVRDQQIGIEPAGAPASISSFSKAIAHCGTQPACFTSRTLPAIRCGPATRASW